jgi:PIN domain nuclease of toxin-antitoxin system
MGAEQLRTQPSAHTESPTIYLLDTAPLLWLVLQPERLSAVARELWQRPETLIAASVVSYWEIAIKASKGKLHLLVCPQLSFDYPAAICAAPGVIRPIRSKEVNLIASLA